MPEQADFFIENDRKVLATRKFLKIPAEPIESRTLGQRILRTDKVGIYDENDKPIYLLGISEDITDKVAAEKAMIAATKAEAAAKAKAAFLSSMNHEMRMPLNAIIGLSTLLGMEFQNCQESDVPMKLKMIEEAGQNLLSLVEKTIFLSDLEAGDVELEMSSLKLSSLINGVWEGLSKKAEAKNITLLSGINDTVKMMADEDLLQAAIRNLLENSITYGAKDNVISVCSEIIDEAHARILFSDIGRGFKSEEVKTAFSSFERLNEIGGTKSGAGVGLTISRRIIEKMGGKISIDPSYTEGARLQIDLRLDTG